jgi:tRNA wybutosine-synthesizing protein 4
VTFVDIDYKDLMLRKRQMVQQTPELYSMLRNLSVSDKDDVLLRSVQYLQIGCDLRDLSTLEKVLKAEFDLDNTTIFCTAEVSIAYMDVATSDELIKWIGALPDARFCLLEQLCPGGPDHPFAKTMLAHFNKLGTPLRPVLAYPTTSAQEQRFRVAGWQSVRARNLWELWGSDWFLSTEDRLKLDVVEPFDEWEEFALFGCHYTLLVAVNRTAPDDVLFDQHPTRPSASRRTSVSRPSLTGIQKYSEYPKTGGIRRFAAPLSVRGQNRQPDLVGNFAGMGVNTREDSCDIFGQIVDNMPYHQQSMKQGPSSRACHTITDLGEIGSLLIGGRTSPDRPLSDCWFYNKLEGKWEQVDDLPVPRYRHCAVLIGGNSVLVCGGKQDSKTILEDAFVWNRQTGWLKCDIEYKHQKWNNEPLAVFGASMAKVNDPDSAHEGGFIVGGLSREGQVQQDIWTWAFAGSNNEHKLILENCGSMARFRDVDRPYASTLTYARFGASVIPLPHGLLLIGGIVDAHLLERDREVIYIPIINTIDRGAWIGEATSIDWEGDSIRPLLVGVSGVLAGDEIVVMGGGAVCFSFGTFWNKGCFTLKLKLEDATAGAASVVPFTYLTTTEVDRSTSKPAATSNNTPLGQPKEPKPILRTKISSAEDFSSIMAAAQPVIIEGLDLGSCTTSWTTDYLLSKIGAQREIVVHQASTSHMDFVSKNFSYVTTTFEDFLSAISRDEKQYLRSLSADKPSEQPADLAHDFPGLAEDFRIPEVLGEVEQNRHSSPLRISGPVDMWLHYDVMSNVLCQIRGSKRLLLFPPADVQYLNFALGASSSSVDAFDLSSPELGNTSPVEAVMQPGDVLFLPPLWLHTARPLEGVSVSVNVFFRGLKQGYAAGKDVYGNRDLQAYEKGRLDVGRIGKQFDGLPADVKKFYLLRLAQELTEKAQGV